MPVRDADAPTLREIFNEAVKGLDRHKVHPRAALARPLRSNATQASSSGKQDESYCG
jgi:hypothetical protein